jgi:hypothetical protein
MSHSGDSDRLAQNTSPFFLAPHFHQAPALLQEGVVEADVFVIVEEQDVAPHRFHRGVAEQALGALVPADDEAVHVHGQHRLVDLVEDLRLVLQLASTCT